jgi:glucoamylase
LIASLSKPWGEETYEAPGVFVGGYHMVWPRDLYHVCAAFIQAGDTQVVTDALRFLRRIQYQDGEWNYGGESYPKKRCFSAKHMD